MRVRSILFLAMILILVASSHSQPNQARVASPAPLQAVEEALEPGKHYYTFKGEYPLLIDNFENYTIGDFPDEGGWILEGYGVGAHMQVIVDDPAMDEKALQLAGVKDNPAVISHSLLPLASILYLDISIYIKDLEEGWYITIIVNQPNITIKIQQGIIIVNNNTINTTLNKGWNRIALTAAQSGESVMIVNNIQYTFKLNQTKTISSNKIAIKTNTQIYVDNIIIKTALYITKLWENNLGDNVESVAWSPDGERIAAGGSFSRLVVFDASGVKIWEKNLSGWIYSVAWSPDGSRIAVGGAFNKVVVFDSSGNLLWERDLGGDVYSVSWSPDGTMIAAGVDPGKVVALYNNGSVAWKTGTLDTDVYSVSWNPNGSELAAGTSGFGDIWYRGNVVVIDNRGNILWKSENLDGWVYSVSWSPDGTMIAVGGAFKKIVVFDSEGNRVWTKYLGDDVSSISWSPDGLRLVVGVGFSIIVLDSEGNMLWSESLGGNVFSVSWSPDGERIAAGGNFKKIVVFSIINSVFVFSGGMFSVIGDTPSGAELCWFFDDGFSTCTTSTELEYIFKDPGWHFVNLSVRSNGVDVYWVAGWVYSNFSAITNTSNTTTQPSTTETAIATTTVTVTTTVTSISISPTTTTATHTVTSTITEITTETVTSISVSPTTVYSTLTKTSTIISPTTSIVTSTIPLTTTLTKITTTTLRPTTTVTSTITKSIPLTSTITSITTETVSWVLMEPERALGIAVGMIIVSLVLARLVVRR